MPASQMTRQLHNLLSVEPVPSTSLLDSLEKIRLGAFLLERGELLLPIVPRVRVISPIQPEVLMIFNQLINPLVR